MIDVGPRIDFSRISFPTDSLTIRHLRRIWPEGFDGPGSMVSPHDIPFFDHLENYGRDTLGSVIGGERELAALVFDMVLGRTGPKAEDKCWEIEECLAGDYARLGLAHGRQHGRQLVRELKAAAAAQAREHLGHLK